MRKPKLYGDGKHDDQPALLAVLAGKPIKIVGDCAHWDGRVLMAHPGRIFRIAQPIVMPPDVSPVEAARKLVGAMIRSEGR